MTTAPELCLNKYERPTQVGGGILYCQYPKDHPAPVCSFRTICMEDSEYLVALARANDNLHTAQPMPVPLRDAMRGVKNGVYDDHLEEILAVTHERKRASRSLRISRSTR